jgi:Leucine-rich repeat (LRR) protein
MQGGDLLCTLTECSAGTTVLQLMQLVEAETGLEANSLLLLDGEKRLNSKMRIHSTLEESELPEIADLHVSPLRKVKATKHLNTRTNKLTAIRKLSNELAEEQLDILDLRDCSKVTDMQNLAQLSQVSVLCLSGCSQLTGVQIVDCVLLTMGGLEDLDISRCSLDASDCIDLAHAAKGSNLLKLDLSDNNMASEDGGRALGLMLKGNTMLEELRVQGNLPTHPRSGKLLEGADGPGFAWGIAEGLSENDELVCLDISNNNIGQLVPPEGWISQRDGYVHEDGRRHNWAPRGSKPAGLVALCDAFKNNTTLTELHLSGNSIGELVLPIGWSKRSRSGPYRQLEGGREPDGIRKEKYRAEQDAPPSGSRPEGVLALAAAIKNHGSLSTVTIFKNDFTQEGLDVIDTLLAENDVPLSICGATGRVLDVSELNAPEITQAGLARYELDVNDAQLIAIEIKYNRLLTKLHLKLNPAAAGLPPRMEAKLLGGGGGKNGGKGVGGSVSGKGGKGVGDRAGGKGTGMGDRAGGKGKGVGRGTGGGTACYRPTSCNDSTYLPFSTVLIQRTNPRANYD